MISFREIADQCDAYDQEVEDISNARKEFWSEIREQIPARDVKALKEAIKARRKLRADPDGQRLFDERVAEILCEIGGAISPPETGTDVATRARAPREEPQAEINRRMGAIWSAQLGKPLEQAIEEAKADLPPHDEDGVIIEPATIIVAAGEAGTRTSSCPQAGLTVSPTLSEPASVTSDAEAGQGEGLERAADLQSGFEPSSVASPTVLDIGIPISDDVPGNGPATAPAPGAGGDTITAKGDAGENDAASVAAAIDASPIKSNAKATEVEPGNAGGTVPVRHNNDRAGVASRLAGGRTPDSEEGGSCALGASPSSHSLSQTATAPPKAVAAAPIELSPFPDNAPGAPITGEMPDIPAFLRRSA